MNLRNIAKFIKKFASAAAFIVYASNAQSTVNVPNGPQPSVRIDQVTTDIAARAHSDVQVRKLLKMFAEKKMDTSALYERLREFKSKK